MKLTPSNAADIAKYYKNTFVKLSPYSVFDEAMPFDPDTLFYIDKAGNGSISGYSQDETPFELILDEENPLELNYPLPHKSFFQLNKSACIMFRVPARQYKRGICSDNTQIYSITSSGALSNMTVGFQNLRAYVTKQKFYSLTEALKNKKSFNSLVLSPRIAYVPMKQLLVVDTVPVGIVDGTRIVLTKPQFAPEVRALLKSNNEDFQVV